LHVGTDGGGARLGSDDTGYGRQQRSEMSKTRWRLQGGDVGSCNCDWGCPCQFNANPTHGDCHVLAALPEQGISASDIDIMARRNPARLLRLDPKCSFHPTPSSAPARAIRNSDNEATGVWIGARRS
jgi:hypothetical protein